MVQQSFPNNPSSNEILIMQSVRMQRSISRAALIKGVSWLIVFRGVLLPLSLYFLLLGNWYWCP